MARICIVLATYNGEKYLAQMLDSLCMQTRPADMIIAVDDGSKDSSPQILQSYANKLPLQISVSAKNQGHRAAFSKALELAQQQLAAEDLIALADQDDIWLPQKLQLLEKSIGENALVFGDAQVVDGSGNSIAPSWRSYASIEKHISMKQQIAGINNVTGCLCLFRAALLGKILPIPEGVTVHDRWIAMLAERNGGIAAIDDAVIQYRIHGGNAVGGAQAASMSTTLNVQVSWAETIIANRSLLQLTDDEVEFASGLVKLCRRRLDSHLVLSKLPWIFKYRRELFLRASAVKTLKRVLFTAVGLPLAKKLWGKS